MKDYSNSSLFHSGNLDKRQHLLSNEVSQKQGGNYKEKALWRNRTNKNSLASGKLKVLPFLAPTFGSAVSSLKASYTCLSLTPPPRSRKLAGFPPCRSIISHVAMARPAPFTVFKIWIHKIYHDVFVYVKKRTFLTIKNKPNFQYVFLHNIVCL